LTASEFAVSNADPHVILPAKKSSELQEFASWFGQDYALFFSNFYEGAAKYIAALPTPRRETLRTELREFLDANPHAPSKKLIKKWLELGADTWDRDLEIRPVLEDFYLMADSNYDLSFMNKGK
jgi:hypothetical protein